MSFRALSLGWAGLTIGLISCGCATVDQRRPLPRRGDQLPSVPTPPPSQAAPRPPVPAQAAAAVQPAAPPAGAPAPATPDITRVSVPPTAGGGAATAPSGAEPDFVKARALHQRAAEAYAGVRDYQARLRRREQVGGKTGAEELILARFRKTPFSVYFKWIGAEGNGRELIYVHGQHDGKVHTLLAPTDPRFLGKIASLAPDSALLRSRSRHPITQAGIGGLLESFDRTLRAGVALKYLGTVQRPEYETPLEGVEHAITEALDAPLAGGKRWWFFDPATGLPVLVIAHDSTGQEIEWYCFDRLMLNVGLDNDDFDPAKLWKDRK